MRRRLDAELLRRGLAENLGHARGLIESGRVLVGGAPAQNLARQVDASESVAVKAERPRFVGRGGEKLAGAIESFGLDFTGTRVLDAGASTGGFTDCALQAGASEVVALDVGHGLIHDRLRRDRRVTLMERQNLRLLDPESLDPFDAVVSDLSFISLTAVMDVLVRCCGPGGWLVLLVKPQFEAERDDVTRGHGIIRDPELWRRALAKVVASAEAHGAAVRGLAPSPIRGADGNVEFLLYLRVGRQGDVDQYRDVGQQSDDDSTGAAGHMIDKALATVAEGAGAASEPAL